MRLRVLTLLLLFAYQTLGNNWAIIRGPREVPRKTPPWGHGECTVTKGIDFLSCSRCWRGRRKTKLAEELWSCSSCHLLMGLVALPPDGLGSPSQSRVGRWCEEGLTPILSGPGCIEWIFKHRTLEGCNEAEFLGGYLNTKFVWDLYLWNQGMKYQEEPESCTPSWYPVGPWKSSGARTAFELGFNWVKYLGHFTSTDF